MGKEIEIKMGIEEYEKPTPEQYGWHNQSGPEDEPDGWLLEGGEEAYYEALKKWEIMPPK